MVRGRWLLASRSGPEPQGPWQPGTTFLEPRENLGGASIFATRSCGYRRSGGIEARCLRKGGRSWRDTAGTVAVGDVATASVVMAFHLGKCTSSLYQRISIVRSVRQLSITTRYISLSLQHYPELYGSTIVEKTRAYTVGEPEEEAVDMVCTLGC